MIPAFVQCLITGNELTAGIVLIYGAIKIRQRIFVFSSDQFQVTNSRFWMEAPSQSSTFLLASFHFLLQRFNKSKTKPKILLFHSNSAVNRRRFSTLEQQPRDTFNHLIICVEHSSSPQKVRKKKEPTQRHLPTETRSRALNSSGIHQWNTSPSTLEHSKELLWNCSEILFFFWYFWYFFVLGRIWRNYFWSCGALIDSGAAFEWHSTRGFQHGLTTLFSLDSNWNWGPSRRQFPRCSAPVKRHKRSQRNSINRLHFSPCASNFGAGKPPRRCISPPNSIPFHSISFHFISFHFQRCLNQPKIINAKHSHPNQVRVSNQTESLSAISQPNSSQNQPEPGQLTRKQDHNKSSQRIQSTLENSTGENPSQLQRINPKKKTPSNPFQTFLKTTRKNQHKKAPEKFEKSPKKKERKSTTKMFQKNV